MVKTSSKSSHHKDANRFKFQTFSEQIARINIDVVHVSRRREAEPQDADSFFAEGLEKWREFNCTQDFVNFSHEISGHVQSFAQLVHFESQVVSALKTHLRVPDSLAYIPLLDLVVQLARDLQTDFYPHFREFFEIVVSLLDTQDTEQIEGAFQCLGYLFKFLWRYLVRDIQDVYSMYSPLLNDDQKAHVRRFAAESFAFLMRKVKDHGSLFDFMLGTLKLNPQQAKGLGNLFFDMFKGVRHQTHSCTEKILPILLSRLGPCRRGDGGGDSEEQDLPWGLVLECQTELFRCLAGYLKRDHAPVVWKALLVEMAFLQEKLASTTNPLTAEALADQLQSLVQLLDQLTSWGSGSLIADSQSLCEATIEAIKQQSLPESHGKTLLSLASSLLHACHGDIAHDHIKQLIQAVFHSKYSSKLILDFSRSVFDIAGFEQDVLSSLCEFCHSKMAEGDPVAMDAILFTLTDLVVTKQPRVEVGSDVVDYRPYVLDFSRQLQISRAKIKKTKKKKQTGTADSIPSFLISQLGEFLEHPTKEGQMQRLWAALLCIPHTRPLEHSECRTQIQDVIKMLSQSVMKEEAEANDMNVYILCIAIQTLLLVSCQDHPSSVLETDLILSLLRHHPSSPHTLLAADCYFSLCEGAEAESDPTTDPTTDPKTNGVPVLTSNTLANLYPILQQNLSSPFSKVRHLTLRILDKFPLSLPSDEDVISVFRLCLNAEEIPVTIETYRDKLTCLGKLEHAMVKHSIPDGGFATVPLKFLIGQLYVNFQLLWDPVSTLIRSHAYGMEKKEFWEIYGKTLKSAAQQNEGNLFYTKSSTRRQSLHGALPRNDGVSPDPADIAGLCCRGYSDACKNDDRPDHENFRRLLWRTMEGFADRAEGRSRELTPLLLQFMRNEYYVTDVNSAPTQDLRQVKGQAVSQSEGATEEEEENPTNDAKGKKKRPVNKSVIAHLGLFSKFKDPKSLYLEPQLKELYFNLLSSRAPDIQKAALACLYTYKYPYLAPYRESLDQLMDDKLFRDALVQFGIDETSGVVEAMHREGLLPILFRLLYGKMLSKTGPGTQGKAGIAIRRSVILRFIAGSSPDEIKVFLDLVLEPCGHLINDDIKEMMAVWTSQDRAAVVPLRKQHSMLDTVGVIFSKLGHRIDPYLPTMLRVIVGALASYNNFLSQRDELQPFCVYQLKNLRQVSVQRLMEFFGRFDEYPFSRAEVQSVFDAAVWPQLDRLTSESVGSPSPLLKLAHTWSQKIRFHPLLIKPHTSSQSSLTLLGQAIGLLSAPRVCPQVVAMVMEMVENLLSLKDDEEEEGEEEGEGEEKEDGIADGFLENLPTGPDGADLSHGARMLMPHIPAILSHLNTAMQQQQVIRQASKKAGPGLPLRELGILYKLSGFVQASDLCSSLVGLLLPYLQKSSRLSENTEVEILGTVKNLMKLVTDPSHFLSPVSRLLYRITSLPSRLVLVSVISAMATRDPALDDIARVVARLNARDRKRLDEPDYTLRLKAFRSANQKLEEETELDVRFFTPLIHNCFYFILKINDMSLRDNASHLLTEITKKLSQSSSDTAAFQTVIEHTFIPALRDGLREKTEVARHESIALLSQLVKAFPSHPHFHTMSVLHDADVETDFFENMRHIQHHRRMRALRRLSKHCQERELSPKVVQHFLLPTATSLIFDPEVSKNMNLVVEAIAAVGGMATVLPWQQYLSLLTQYLRLLMRGLEYQKIAVRLIVAVLDAFHFDLSLSAGLDPKPDGKEESGKGAKTDEENKEGPNVADKLQEGVEGALEKEEEMEEEDEKEEDAEREVEDDEEEAGHDSGIEDEKDKTESEREKQVAMATRIHRTIARSILPQLHKIITKKTRSEGEHKKARHKIADDEEVLRVPLALAVIKLLQALPKETMDQHLYSVLLKVCQMLRSRAMDVRTITRETLVKILDSLGVKYFWLILKQLRSNLTRGFELHVLGFTVHMLLKSLSPKLVPGGLDSCLDSLIQVFTQELFGAVSEEKEVEGIVGKLFEARSIKAYDCYEIVSRFVGQGSISKLITPLNEVLDTSNSHRAVNRVRETLRRCTIGLQENAGISQDALLIFVHGLTSETLPVLTREKKSGPSKAEPACPGQRPASTYLLPPVPTRAGIAPDTSPKTHLHLLIEFGLQLLNMSLKRSKLVATNAQHLSMLDPFMAVLLSSLDSSHTRVITIALRCLCWLMRYPLPALADTVTPLTQTLFRLLRKHARVGAAKGENFELMVVTFKAVTVLIRDVGQHTINEKQLQVLLAYAEEDVHDYTRQATAFGMLKAILSRKLVAPEMHSIMDKVAKLSVSEQSSAVRLQCRQVMHQFLLDYPLGKKLKRHLEFYVKQLSFSVEAGRESALEMLATIYSTFPQKILVEYAGLFFIPMATRLVNDDSANCRKLTALALSTLLDKLTLEKRDELFNITLHWLQDDKPSHQRLAAQLCGLFVDSEKESFGRRLSDLLPVIEDIVQPAKVVEVFEEEMEEKEAKAQDHLLFHVLSALSKLNAHCPLSSSHGQPHTVRSIWESIEAHLLHPHTWVRLLAARLFGELFGAWQPDSIVAMVTDHPQGPLESQTQSGYGSEGQMNKKKKKKKKKKGGKEEAGADGGIDGRDGEEDSRRGEEFGYFHANLAKRMMGLADKFCKQLNSSLVTKELAEQDVKNLIFIAKVIRRLPSVGAQSGDKEQEDEGESKKDEKEEEDSSLGQSEGPDRIEGGRREEEETIVGMVELVQRMSRIAATEVAKTAKITIRRASVVKWMVAMAMDMGRESLLPFLPSMLHVVGREVNDTSAQADAELKSLCQEVLELLKSLVGLDTFSEVYAAVQRSSNETRIARKRKRALEAVADPEKAAFRKMKKQQLKKESRKRKLQQMRPTYHINKRPRVQQR